MVNGKSWKKQNAISVITIVITHFMQHYLMKQIKELMQKLESMFMPKKVYMNMEKTHGMEIKVVNPASHTSTHIQRCGTAEWKYKSCAFFSDTVIKCPSVMFK